MKDYYSLKDKKWEIYIYKILQVIYLVRVLHKNTWRTENSMAGKQSIREIGKRL